jgi:hypothetical protein
MICHLCLNHIEEEAKQRVFRPLRSIILESASF